MASETELARIIKRETEQTNPEIDPIELTPFALICAPLAPPAVNGAAGHCAKYEQALGGRHVLSQSIANLRPLEVRYDHLKNVYGRGPVATADNLTKHTCGSDNNRADDKLKSFAAFVGRVNTLYEFGAMCDFQYLPVRNKVDSKEKVLKSDDLHNQLIPSDIAGALSWWDQNSGTNLDGRQTLLLPSAFSRSTAPSPFILTRQIDHADQSVNLKLGQILVRGDDLGAVLATIQERTRVPLVTKQSASCLRKVHLPVAERFSAAGQPVPVDAEFPNPAPSQTPSKDTSPDCGTADGDIEGTLDVRCDPVNGHLPPDALTLVRNAIRSDVYKTLGVTSGLGASAGGDDSMDAAFDDADDDGEQEDYDDVDVSFDDDT